MQAARCIATKACVSAAPRSFRIGTAGVVEQAGPGGDTEENLVLAAEACPTGAITVLRDGVRIA